MGDHSPNGSVNLAEAPRSSARDVTFDILKGIGIVEVLLHHTLSFSARKFTTYHSIEWWVMTISNRILHFAIPTFLMISALLLVRGLAKREKPDYRKFYLRRVTTTVIPFVLWTTIYLVFRLLVIRVGSDIVPTTYQVPVLGWTTAPNIVLDPEIRWNAYVWGKGFFHLYFFSVLIQLSLLIPLCLTLFKKFQPKFSTTVLTAVTLQLAFFCLQSFYFRFPAPASLIFSYVPAILIGTWVGLNWSDWEKLWKSIRIPTYTLFLVGGGIYIGKSAMLFGNGKVVSLVLNIAFSVYATTAALILLAWAQKIRKDANIAKVLAYLGSLSLPIFVIHPMALYFLGGPTIGKFFDFVPFTPFWIFGMVLVLTLIAARILAWLRLDKWLFGRKLSFQAVAEGPVEANSVATR